MRHGRAVPGLLPSPLPGKGVRSAFPSSGCVHVGPTTRSRSRARTEGVKKVGIPSLKRGPAAVDIAVISGRTLRPSPSDHGGASGSDKYRAASANVYD